MDVGLVPRKVYRRSVKRVYPVVDQIRFRAGIRVIFEDNGTLGLVGSRRNWRA